MGAVPADAEPLQHGCGRFHHRRRHGQIINTVGPNPPFFLDLLQTGAEGKAGGGITHILGEIGEGGGKFVPVRLIHCSPAGEQGNPLLKTLSEGFVFHLPATDADNGKPFRKLPVQPQIVESGDKFALGQVAATAENDHNGRGKRYGLRHG